MHTAILARVAAVLASSADVAAACDGLVDAFCPDLADTCEIVLRRQDGELWRVSAGPGEMARRLRLRVPTVPEHPMQRAAAGDFLVIDADDDPSQQLFGPSDVPTSARALGLRRAVVTPVSAGATIIGALALAMRSDERRFVEGDLELVRLVGALAGRTIDHLQTAEQQRRVTARLRSAGVIGAELASASAPRAIAELLLHRAAEELDARSGLVYLVDGESLELAASFGHAPDRIEPWHRVPLGDRTPAGHLAAGGTASMWLQNLDEVSEMYPAVGSIPDAETRSLAGVRLEHGDTVVGAAFWIFDVEQRFDDADRGFLELLAKQTSAAMSRARTAEQAAEAMTRLLEIEQRQRVIASTLQASLLPHALPTIPGYELHVEYWAAATDMEVGGDFYDAFAVGDQRWAFVLGDVCGKGAAAAASIGTARQSMRAAAMHIRDERRAIRWVHDAISQADAPFCTLAYLILDLRRRPVLRTVLAGHDRGLRVRADGRVDDLGRFGTLLGVVEPVVHVERTSLSPGDLIVFHTDGLTDAPAGEALTREELATLVVAHRDQPLAEIGRAVRAELDARRPAGDRDDIALLLLRAASP